MATPGNLGSSVLASKTKTKKKHFVAQKVKLFRASDPLLSVLMWGVNHSINELSHVQIPVMLMPDDFKAYSKIKVDNHLFNKENMPSHFKFKEYCPMVFRNLRERFGIDDQDFQYIVECHGVTLLPQFLGMYRLNVDGVEIYVIVTRNVFSHRLSVYRKYDLKGSTVAREASDKEKAKELPTLKDNDFINEGQKIYIDDNNKKIFLEKLKKDVEFLAQLKLMDYSLLVGIHDVERAEQEEVEYEENDGEEEGESDGTHPIGTPPDSPGNTLNSSPPLAPGEFDPNIDVYAIKCHENSPRKEVYFMAIIDILTHYDAKKKAAHAAKTVKHGAGAEISTVNPEQYSKRFFGLYWSHLDVTSCTAPGGHEHGKAGGGFGIGKLKPNSMKHSPCRKQTPLFTSSSQDD
ncbi:phosphatidylinositol 5-phosphate 4-kinase type-2 alpha isoform X2 [Mesocricetus auratus]|uniref:Phosphatidylinositol 5-phosphate 4-kinase type-2 alpha n=1 Tax=Mesocricetus auratus TaxID=10036 RepID=A0ABM2Y9B9_MESAU|nr:phosphatidylinositol 5-phosphate 4-kinase type-2 alpha isoform X2 [Mesocricetus auratus]